MGVTMIVCLFSAQISTSWTSPPTILTWRPSRHWPKHSTSLRSVVEFLLLFCLAADRRNSVVCVSLWQGGVVLVSHDERLIRLVCRELWVCEAGQVRRIDGGFDEYRDILHEQFKKEGYL